jgi:hypothetical protein
LTLKKSNTRHSIPPSTPSKATSAPATRVFGSAKGQIVFKKGWDAPMTKRELDQFTGVGDLGPDLRKLKKLMKAFRNHE